MGEKLEILKRDYAVSDTRLVNLILKSIGGLAGIELMAMDGKKYRFEIEMGHNLIREILIILEGIHQGFQEAIIRNEDGEELFIKISSNIIECTADNKVISKVKGVLSILKNCDDKGMTRVVQLGYENISIVDIIDISDKLGSLLDAETIQIESEGNNSKIHIIKYKEFSVGLYKNVIYLIDFGLSDGSLSDIALKINKHISGEMELKYSLEEYFIR